MIKHLRALCAVATLLLVWTALLAPKQALAQATQVPPGKVCFQATTGTTGMIGTLGAVTTGFGGGNGTYGGVALTGGTGTGATANVTVSASVVTSVAVLNPGVGYVVGDVLSAVPSTIGGVSGFSVPVASVAINSSLAGGTVGMYIPSTLTPKQTWQDAAETILNTNPVALDANGCALIYGTGTYRQIVYDSLGNRVWDQLAYASGGGVGGGAIVATNALLAASSTANFPSGVIRQGITTAGDAPPLMFVPSASSCSIPGGDIGSQVPSSDGKCWIANYASGGMADAREWGAKCDGSDATSSLNAAFAYGGNIYISCQFTITSGVLTLGSSKLHVIGQSPDASKILCRNTNFSCLAMPGVVQLSKVEVDNITIDGTGQVAGICLDFTGATDSFVSNVVLNSCYNGALFAWINNVSLKNNVTISARGSYALRFYTDPTTGKRGDVLNIDGLSINNNFSGADGIVWDGASYTLRITNSNTIATKRGFWIANTLGCPTNGTCNTSNGPGYPQFADVANYEIDGASLNACRFDTGFDLMIANLICSNQTGASGQGSADGPALLINADTSAGVTRTVKITNSHVGDGQQQSMLINGCQDCYFSNLIADDGSHAGINSFPAVEVGTAGANITFVGGKFGPTLGNSALTSYGLKVGAGSGGISAIGVNFTNNQTGSVLDATGNLQVIGGFDYQGNAYGPLPVSNYMVFAGAVPSVSSCGSGATISGHNGRGTVTTGTGTVNSCVITFNTTQKPAPTGAPSCFVTPSGTGYTAAVTARSASSFTIGFSASEPSTVIDFGCDFR